MVHVWGPASFHLGSREEETPCNYAIRVHNCSPRGFLRATRIRRTNLGAGPSAGRARVSRRGSDRPAPVRQDHVAQTRLRRCGFLSMHPPPAIFDEVQYAPVLLPYVKERIDAERSKTGQYLLTGSQNLLLLERVTESLAGRAAMLKLLPFSRREMDGRAQAPLPWESKWASTSRRQDRKSVV